MRPIEPPEDGSPTGGLVPLLDHLDLRPIAVGDGRSRVEVVIAPIHLRSKGIAHGGLFAALLDTTLGWAAGSLAPEGMDVVTAQLNINFIRPARPGERLIAEAEVQHSGRRTAVARAEVKTADGHLAATGSATFLFVRLDGPGN